MCQATSDERGFTLIEMVVATVLLAVAISGALAAFGTLSRASGLAAEYDRAAMLAERRLAEVEALGVAAATADAGEFGDEAPGWRWEQEVLEADTEGVVELRVTISWESGDRRRQFQVSTYLLDDTDVAVAGI